MSKERERRPDGKLEQMRDCISEEERKSREAHGNTPPGVDKNIRESCLTDIEIEEDREEKLQMLLDYEIQYGELEDFEREDLGVKGKLLTRYKSWIEQYRDKNGVLQPEN